MSATYSLPRFLVLPVCLLPLAISLLPLGTRADPPSLVGRYGNPQQRVEAVIPTARGGMALWVNPIGLCFVDNSALKPADPPMPPAIQGKRGDVHITRAKAGDGSFVLWHTSADNTSRDAIPFTWTDQGWMRGTGIVQPRTAGGSFFSFRFHTCADGTHWAFEERGSVYRFVDGKPVASPIQAVNPRNGEALGRGGAWFDPFELADGSHLFLACYLPRMGGKLTTHGLLWRHGASEAVAYPHNFEWATQGPDGTVWLAGSEGLFRVTAEAPLEARLVMASTTDTIALACLGTLPDGTVVSLWKHDGSNDGDSQRILMETRDHQNRTLADVLSPQDGVSTSHVDPQGGLWIMCGNFTAAYRSPDGDWSRLDWRNGLPNERIVSLTSDQQGRLWMISERGICRVYDRDILRRPVADTERSWTVLRVSSQLVSLRNGQLCTFSLEQGGSIALFNRDGPAYLPLDRALFAGPGGASLTDDSEGHPWVIGPAGVAYHDGATWKIFTEQTCPRRTSPRLCAFASVCHKGADYYIGNRGDAGFPVFTDDHRFAWNNGWAMLYHDGKKAQVVLEQTSTPFGIFTGREIPFFHERRVHVTVGDATYRLKDQLDEFSPKASWEQVPTVICPFAPWTTTNAPVRETRLSTTLRDTLRALENQLPVARDPYQGQEIKWQDQLWWFRTDDTLYWSTGDDWRTLPLQESPLEGINAIYDTFHDSQGQWWFQTQHGHAVYRGPLTTLKSDQLDLGTIDHPFSTVTPAIDANVPMETLLFRYRVDEGPWSDYQPGTTLALDAQPAGRHHIDLEAIGRSTLRCSNRLRFDLVTSYDLRAAMDAEIARLVDRSPQQQQQARETLRRFGDWAIIPLLQAQRQQEDLDLQMRAHECLDQIITPATDPAHQPSQPAPFGRPPIRIRP